MSRSAGQPRRRAAGDSSGGQSGQRLLLLVALVVFAWALATTGLLESAPFAGWGGPGVPGAQETETPVDGTPGTGAPGSGTPGTGTPASGEGEQSALAHRSPRALLVDAHGIVCDATTPSDATETHRRQSAARYEEAVIGYDSPVDPGDRGILLAADEGTRELAETLSVNDSTEPTAAHLNAVRNASGLAVLAGEVTAEWRLAQATRTYRHHYDDLTDAQRDRVENEIASAEAAFDEGATLQDGAAQRVDSDDHTLVKEATYDRGRAIDKYSIAWMEASEAIDVVESADAASNATDADRDGLTDAREAALGTDPADADSDGDGNDDWTETAGGFPLDSTGDGVLDALDGETHDYGTPDLSGRDC